MHLNCGYPMKDAVECHSVLLFNRRLLRLSTACYITMELKMSDNKELYASYFSAESHDSKNLVSFFNSIISNFSNFNFNPTGNCGEQPISFKIESDNDTDFSQQILDIAKKEDVNVKVLNNHMKIN